MKTLLALLLLIPNLSWGEDDISGKYLICEIKQKQLEDSIAIIEFKDDFKAKVSSIYANWHWNNKLQEVFYFYDYGSIEIWYKNNSTNIRVPWGYEYESFGEQKMQFHGWIDINRQTLNVEIDTFEEGYQFYEMPYDDGKCKISNKDKALNKISEIENIYQLSETDMKNKIEQANQDLIDKQLI